MSETGDRPPQAVSGGQNGPDAAVHQHNKAERDAYNAARDQTITNNYIILGDAAQSQTPVPDMQVVTNDIPQQLPHSQRGSTSKSGTQGRRLRRHATLIIAILAGLAILAVLAILVVWPKHSPATSTHHSPVLKSPSIATTFTDPGHNPYVDSVAFSRNGAFLATGDRNNDGASLWSMATRTRTLLHTFTDPGGSWVESVALSPDGAFLATGTTVPVCYR